MERLVDVENDPVALEERYQNAPEAFEEALETAYAQRLDLPVFQVWHARLSFDNSSDSPG